MEKQIFDDLMNIRDRENYLQKLMNQIFMAKNKENTSDAHLEFAK